jgi:hypothetical protein
VAYEVIRHLPRKDALNCRLVCGSWDTEACRLLRKEFTLEFHDLCQVHKFHTLLDESAVIKGSTRDIPFARIHLRASFRLGHSLAQEFFKVHGHIIQHLHILKVGCDCGANFFQKLLFFQATNLLSLNLQIISAPIRLSPQSGYMSFSRAITQSHNHCHIGDPLLVQIPPSILSNPKLELPHLKRLHLRHQLFIERAPFVRELLRAVTNLESLTTDPASPEFCASVFLPFVLDSPNKWAKLTRILCGQSITFSGESQLQKFYERHIPLKELKIQFNIKSSLLEPIGKEGLLKLLKICEKSLVILELNNRQTDVSFELESIPTGMKKLTSLRLVNVALEPRWLQVLPSLKNFAFIEEEPSGLCIPLANLDTFYNPMLAYPPLSRLALSPMCILNIQDLNDMGLWWDKNAQLYMRTLARAFPKLKVLSLNGNDSVLKGIYEEFEDLESLSIHGPISDEGLTGIPVSICDVMHKQLQYDDVINLDDLAETKFIGDLKSTHYVKNEIGENI